MQNGHYTSPPAPKVPQCPRRCAIAGASDGSVGGGSVGDSVGASVGGGTAEGTAAKDVAMESEAAWGCGCVACLREL